MSLSNRIKIEKLIEQIKAEMSYIDSNIDGDDFSNALDYCDRAMTRMHTLREQIEQLDELEA